MFLLLSIYAEGQAKGKALNSPPEVRIIKPQSALNAKANTLVQFEIEVSDQEDGMSEYDEINGSEVILQVNYFADTLNVAAHLDQQLAQMPTGLRGISRANCLSCHRPHSRLIGPTFAEIAMKYQDTYDAVNYLQEKIIAGSKGLWGEVEMPPNPEITDEQAKDMVEWILDECTKDDVEYYVGLSGVFRTKLSTEGNEGHHVLTAMYQDHGLANQLHTELMGKHSVVVNVSE